MIRVVVLMILLSPLGALACEIPSDRVALAATELLRQHNEIFPDQDFPGTIHFQPKLQIGLSKTNFNSRLDLEGFTKPLRGNYNLIPLLGLAFEVPAKTLAYVCIHLNDLAPEETRIEIRFLEIADQSYFSRGTKVVDRPLKISFRPVSEKTQFIDQIFGQMILLGPLIKLIDGALSLVEGGINQAVHVFAGVGVSSVLITDKGIELRPGAQIMGQGAPLLPSFIPFE